MKAKAFEKIVKNRLKHCKKLLCSKGDEYARGDDRLHNFKKAAAMSHTTPEDALWGMWVKHLVSVKDMVDDPKRSSDRMIDEKISDLINYGLLLEAILKEKSVTNNK